VCLVFWLFPVSWHIMSGSTDRPDPQIDDEDEESDEDTAVFKPFSQRPEWADVEGIPQDDGPFNVVKIAYSDQYTQTMNCFRAVMQSGEKSQRALALTAEVVNLNPANYVGWWYRRHCLAALGSDLTAELAWMRPTLLGCTKNYQMWFHRRELVGRQEAPNIEDEKAIIDEALKEDAKNYHSWCYRRWLVQHFQAYAGELEWCTRLLTNDLRNNSAWNYRYFLVETRHTHGLSDAEKFEVLKHELRFTCEPLKITPNNESPYNYVFGLCSLLSDPSYLLRYIQMAVQFLIATGTANPTCTHTRATLILFLERLAEQCRDLTGVSDAELVAWAGSQVDNYKACLQTCKELQKMDAIRKKYWFYQQQRFTAKIQEVQA